MNKQEIEIMVAAMMFILGIIVIIYDRIKYRKYYVNQGKLIVLRLNNAYVRQILEGNGFNLCMCAYYNTNRYLFTVEGDRICGFTEECTHLIADATKNHQEVVDCGISINRFVYEVHKVQKQYNTDENEDAIS